MTPRRERVGGRSSEYLGTSGNLLPVALDDKRDAHEQVA